MPYEPKMPPKPTRYRVDYDDGSYLLAEGKDAEEILRWIGGCEAMAYVHGARYKGPLPENHSGVV